MDQAKDIDLRLLITTSCLIGLALVFLLARVLDQVLKRYDIGWDDFSLITSLVGLSSLTADSYGVILSISVSSDPHLDRYC